MVHRFGSRGRRLRNTNLVHSLYEERPIGRLQRLLGSPKRRISQCTESPNRECELTESANRSIARRAQLLRSAATKPPSRLDKQCLLIEVRTRLWSVASCL